MKTCCIISANNEEKHLRAILKEIKDHNIDVIVIDDGSTDNTPAIAEDEGARLIRHPSCKGKGSSLRDGFRAALEKDYDLFLTIDADGQHALSEIPLFLNKISAGPADIVIGNRLHHPKDMPRYRIFINRLFSAITSLVTRQNIKDGACGYRIMTRRVLESVKLTTERFDTEYELIIKAAKAGFKTDFVDIECIYTGGASHIRPAQYWNDFFGLVFRELVSK